MKKTKLVLKREQIRILLSSESLVRVVGGGGGGQAAPRVPETYNAVCVSNSAKELTCG